MSDSAVSICNRALQRLSASRITALDQNHPNARSCSLAYDPLRRRLLRTYAWGFAKARASLAADVDQTEWGTLNRYELPNDFIRLIRPSDVRTDWEIEGRFIVTADSGALDIRYIFDEDNPENFDPLYVEALSCLIAYEICEDVTGSTSKKQSLAADLKQIIGEARQMNAFEKEPEVPVTDDFILAML